MLKRLVYFWLLLISFKIRNTNLLINKLKWLIKLRNLSSAKISFGNNNKCPNYFCLH